MYLLLEVNIIGKSRTSIKNNEFSGNKQLEIVLIAKEVERIGAGAFYNCTNLRCVYFDKNSHLKYIDNSVFQNCSNLEIIELPDSVEYIHSHCFWNCLKLPKNITLPKNLKYIEATAFYNTRIKTAILPTLCKYQKIDKGFPFQPSFPEKCKIIGGTPYDFFCSLELPFSKPIIENICDYEKEVIANNQFSERADLTNFIVGKQIKKIEANAFYFCKNLINVIFEKDCSVKYIDYFTFQNCLSLEKIEFAEGLKQIKAHSFWACSSLKEITFPNSLEIIDASAFFTSGLTQVNLPPNCKYQVKGHGFPYEASFPENCIINGGIPYDFYRERPFPVPPYNVLELKDISTSSEEIFIVPQGTKRISNNQFSNRNDLKSIIIPKSVEVIGAGAFYLCKNLETVEFETGSNLKCIDHYAFQNCFSLQKISFPNGILCLRAHAFWACDNLEEAIFPDSIQIIDATVFYTTKLKKVVLPVHCKYQGIRITFPYETSFPEDCIVVGGINSNLYKEIMRNKQGIIMSVKKSET